MRRPSRRWSSAAWIFVAALLAGLALPAPSMAEGRRATMQDVKAIVQRHLASNPSYRRGDLIAREDVEPIFNELLKLGVKPFDQQEELYDSFVPADSLLVQVLRTPQGRAFMRKASQTPGAYDRLERLAWMPQGQALLQQMVRSPDGPEQLQRLSSAEGMQLVAKQLGDDSRGRNFSLPTGHIHTEDQLLTRLQTISARQGVR